MFIVVKEKIRFQTKTPLMMMDIMKGIDEDGRPVYTIDIESITIDG